jgi:hypothetical protein
MRSWFISRTSTAILAHSFNCRGYRINLIGNNTVMDLFNALPGNSSVNTFLRATMEALLQLGARQQFCKQSHKQHWEMGSL